MILRHGLRSPIGVLTALPFLAILVLLSPAAVSAQGGTAIAGSLTGRVTDRESGRPIATAQVMVGGTVLSGVTDVDGVYRIGNIAPGEVELRVQRIGYAQAVRTVVIPAAGGVVTADFELAASPLALDALVVTATGPQRRRELGNATATIDVSRELQSIAPTTLAGLLQGRATGVQVLQGAGSVGTAATIRMRGYSSIGLDNTPIIYIDGARVSNFGESGPEVGGQTTSRLNDLNLDEIESVEIVKGPSAATLYGTEAAAGVILITTKRGRAGRAEWTLRTSYGTNRDASEWPETVFNPRSFFGPTATDTLYTLNLLEGVGTELNPWRSGREKTTGISLVGGADGVNYFLAGDWNDTEGSLANNSLVRRNVRANLDLTPSDRVRVAVSAGFGSSQLTLPNNDNDVFGYIGVAQIGFPWEIPLVRDDPTTGQPGVETCPADYEGAKALGIPLGFVGCQGNPFFAGRTFEDVATLANSQKIERFTGSATVDVRPYEFLSATGTVGYDQFSDQTGIFVPVDPDLPFDDSSLGLRSINSIVNRNLTVEGNVAATFELTPDLESVTTVGGQFYRLKQELVGSIGRILPSGTGTVSNAVRTEGYEQIGESRVLGLFVQQQFGWRDRLFLTPAVRFDEASGFEESLGRKSYPRVMASYVMSDESWFDRWNPGSVIEGLRLRGAWGTSGKQPSAFASVPILAARRVTFQGQDVAGVVVTRPGNPDLRPESGREIELGFESEMFDGRFGVDFTWYRKVTRDAIVTRPVAPSSGYSAELATNIGEIRNHGIEVGLSAVAVNTPLVRWDWRLNLTSTHNEITRMVEPIHFGLGENSQRHQEGFPFGSYWSYSYSMDANGAIVRSDTAVYVGQPTPKFDGSLSTTLTLLGGISLHADLGFARGFQQLNGTQQFQCGFMGGGEYGGICREIYEVGPDGQRTEMARIKAQAAQDQQYAPWVEDADFIRLRTVSLQVLLPPSLMRYIGASRGGFSIAAENLALFTNYSGMDPEVNAAGGDQWIRAEFLTLPPARRIVGRVAITF